MIYNILHTCKNRQEYDGLQEVWQLYVLNNRLYILSICFCNSVGEMVFQSFYVGRQMRNSLRDVESQGCEAILVKVDFLVVWHLANLTVRGMRIS